MVESYDDWAQSINNTRVWDPRLPGATIAQCTYLWRSFLQRVIGAPWEAGVAAGVGTARGHAFQLWTQFGQSGNGGNNSVAPNWLTMVPRAQGGQRGDAVIWQPYSGWTLEDGHVAVLDEDLGPGNGVRVWSQNDAANHPPARLLTLTGSAANGIYGFLRPKVNQPGGPTGPTDPTNPTNPDTEDFLMALSQYDQELIRNTVVSINNRTAELETKVVDLQNRLRAKNADGTAYLGFDWLPAINNSVVSVHNLAREIKKDTRARLYYDAGTSGTTPESQSTRAVAACIETGFVYPLNSDPSARPGQLASIKANYHLIDPDETYKAMTTDRFNNMLEHANGHIRRIAAETKRQTSGGAAPATTPVQPIGGVNPTPAIS